jgi:hypothetical protein
MSYIKGNTGDGSTGGDGEWVQNKSAAREEKKTIFELLG